jgi:hypothetical protein
MTSISLLFGSQRSQTIVVTVTAAWNGTNLLPSAHCVVNGVNVGSSWLNHGNSSYSFSYTVAPGDSTTSTTPLTFALSLQHPQQLVPSKWSSDAVTERTLPSPGSITVDALAPSCVFTCGPPNGSYISATTTTLCILCSSDGELDAAVVWYRVNDGSAAAVAVAGVNVNDSASTATRTTVRVPVGPSANGDVMRVLVWSVDGSGNVGPSTATMWRVDTVAPETRCRLRPPTRTSSRSAEFAFDCTKDSGCTFVYSFNGGPRQRLSDGNTSDSTGSHTWWLETLVVAGPARYSNSSSASFAVRCVIGNRTTTAAASAWHELVNSPTARLQVRTDSAVIWQSVLGEQTSPGTFIVHVGNVTESRHVASFRCVSEDGGQEDVTPVSYVWTVTRQAPTIALLSAPPVTSAVPSGSATFVLQASSRYALARFVCELMVARRRTRCFLCFSFGCVLNVAQRRTILLRVPRHRRCGRVERMAPVNHIEFDRAGGFDRGSGLSAASALHRRCWQRRPSRVALLVFGRMSRSTSPRSVRSSRYSRRRRISRGRLDAVDGNRGLFKFVDDLRVRERQHCEY